MATTDRKAPHGAKYYSSIFCLLSFFKSHIVLGKKIIEKQYPGYRFG
jgi:hypothetical protein